MAGLNGVSAVRSVAQVAQIHLASKGQVFFDPLNIFEALRLPVDHRVDARLDAVKNVLHGFRLH